MKKIVILIVVLILSISSVVSAEPIDESYINLIFSKLGSMTDDQRTEAVSLLSTFITSDVGLEVLYLEALKQDEAMKSYGISESDIRRNINALKTWSEEDRIALVNAGAAGNMTAIEALNLSNSEAKIVEVKSVRAALISKEIAVKPYLAGKTFEDVEKHWSKDHVNYLVDRGIISGKSETEFDPEASISKAEIVTLVTRLMIEDMSKIPVYTGSTEDITSGKWYDGHMQRGVVLGLVSDGIDINPNHKSSREEVVEILINAINALEINIDDSMKVYSGDFTDFETISDSRKEAMTIAINLGFISGKGNGIIDPTSEIKRSEIAVVVKKLYEYVVKNM